MVKDTIETLTKDAERIRNTDPADLSNMEVGDEHRQGDLRIIRLADDFIERHLMVLTKLDRTLVQIAPGVTQGSRHELASIDGITMFSLKDATALDGPIIKSDRPFDINHPEHGNAVNLPAGCYAFPGQRAFADELKRVAD